MVEDNVRYSLLSVNLESVSESWLPHLHSVAWGQLLDFCKPPFPRLPGEPNNNTALIELLWGLSEIIH